MIGLRKYIKLILSDLIKIKTRFCPRIVVLRSSMVFFSVFNTLDANVNILLQGQPGSQFVDFMISGGVTMPSQVSTSPISGSGRAYLPDINANGNYSQHHWNFTNFMLSEESMVDLPVEGDGIAVSINGQPIGIYESVDFLRTRTSQVDGGSSNAEFETLFIPSSSEIIDYPALEGGDLLEWNGVGRIKLPTSKTFDDLFSQGLKYGASTQIDGSRFKIRLVSYRGANQFNPFVSQVVPFVKISDTHATADWKINPVTLESELKTPSRTWALPIGSIPMKTFAIPINGKLAVLREMFTGRLTLCDLGENNIESLISFPDSLSTSVFRGGVIYSNRLYIIVFDGSSSQNWMLRTTKLDSDLSVTFDPDYQLAIGAPGVFHFDYRMGLVATEESIHVAGGNYYGTIQPEAPNDNVAVHQLNRQDLFVKMVGSANNAIALFVDTLSEDYGFDNPIVTSNNFHLIEFNNNRKSGLDQVVSAPKSIVLHENNVLDLKFATNISEHIDLYRSDLIDTHGSGTLFLGANNAEGRIAWAASYYLDGFCDILSHRLSSDDLSPELEKFYNDLRTRLDLEMWMLDRLHDFGRMGMHSIRYGLDRSKPLLFAVHTGRLASLISAYWDLGDSVPAMNFEDVIVSAHTLSGHVEEIKLWEVIDDDVRTEIPMVTTRKGIPVSFDGVPVPYNMQNAWAAAVLSSPLSSNEQKNQALAMIKYFIKNEKLHLEAESANEWLYWHGPAREGWDETAAISENNPSYSGHRGFAAVSYRYMDAKAVFVAHAQFPEDRVLKAATNNLKAALENGLLWLANTWQNGNEESVGELDSKHLARAWRSTGSFSIINSSAAFRHSIANLNYISRSSLDSDLDGISDELEIFYGLDPQKSDIFHLNVTRNEEGRGNGITLSWSAPEHLSVGILKSDTVNGFANEFEPIMLNGENEVNSQFIFQFNPTSQNIGFFRLYVRGRKL